MKTVSEQYKIYNFELKNAKVESKSSIDVRTQAVPVESATPAAAPSIGSSLLGIWPLIIMIFAFYFLIIRPGQKRQKELNDKISKVKKDDKVRTAGGIIAVVDKVEDNEVVLKVDDKTKITFVKSAIVEIYTGLAPAK